MLANELIRYPQAAPVADLLWARADLEQVDRVAACPSPAYVDEALSMGSSAAQHVAQYLPSPQLIDHAWKLTRSLKVREGLLANPAASDHLLNQAGRYPALADDSSTWQQRRKEWRNASVDELAEALRSEQVDLATLLEKARQGTLPEVLRKAGAQACEDTLNRLAAGHPPAQQQACAALAGIIDPRDAGPISVTVADWLANSGSPVAQTSRDILQQEPELLHQRIMSREAAVLLHEAGLLPPALQRKQQMPQGAQQMSWAELQALQAGGLDANAIAVIALNSSMAITARELSQLLTAADMQICVNYALGQAGRQPRPGDIAAIVSALGREGRARFASMLPGNASELAWFADLAMELPTSSLAGASEQARALIATRIKQRLGEAVPCWEFTIALSSEWESSLTELLDTALLMQQGN